MVGSTPTAAKSSSPPLARSQFILTITAVSQFAGLGLVPARSVRIRPNARLADSVGAPNAERTNVLVVGVLDPARRVPGDITSRTRNVSIQIRILRSVVI